MSKTSRVLMELEELRSGKSGIESSTGSMSFSGHGATGLFRLLTLRRALKMEAIGMRLTAKAPKATTILRREYNMKGSREKLSQQLEALIAEYEQALAEGRSKNP